jgi:hypothetical protein
MPNNCSMTVTSIRSTRSVTNYLSNRNLMHYLMRLISRVRLG